MVIKGNGAVNTMEAVKSKYKRKTKEQRLRITKGVFSSVLTGITWGAAILALPFGFLVGFILIRGVKKPDTGAVCLDL